MESRLVRFAPHPSPDSLWAGAGHDASAFGAALDRLFGETADIHLLEHFTVASDPILIADDPLVLLANLTDGVSLPMAEPVALPMPELAAVYDFGSGTDGLNAHDLWMFDSHA
jgi:hypothetical protein